MTLADITTQIEDLDDKFGSGAPASWVAVDSRAWRDVFNFDRPVISATSNAARTRVAAARRSDDSGFVVFTFNSGDAWGVPIRGDLGVRYVQTDQHAMGHIPVRRADGRAVSERRSAAGGRYCTTTTRCRRSTWWPNSRRTC